ncbi:MAG: hypothetical protein JW963_08945 [Anaerolineales bacterium]|nr:hypothetical protein [Anaerolineales bacterium]
MSTSNELKRDYEKILDMGDSVTRLSNEYRQKRREIETNGDLSQAGRQKALASLDAEKSQALRNLSKDLRREALRQAVSAWAGVKVDPLVDGIG